MTVSPDWSADKAAAHPPRPPPITTKSTLNSFGRVFALPHPETPNEKAGSPNPSLAKLSRRVI